MFTLLDLVLPRECGGCRAPGTSWCADCADELDAEPLALAPTLEVGAPAWATGSYGGARRRAVIEAKERGRRDLATPLGVALAGAVRTLRTWGDLDPPELAALVLVPAPSRAAAARRRGGDPVERMVRRCAQALAADGETVGVWAGLRSARGVRDSVGLSAAQRAENLAGRVQVRGAPGPGQVVLVDDVLTTGATAAAATVALGRAGVRVGAVLVVAGVR